MWSVLTRQGIAVVQQLRAPEISDAIDHVREQIREAAIAAGRDPGEIRIVAVSKTVPADRVREAVAAGVSIVGENYIQEARDKAAALSHLPIFWHFIGHLQSKKSKYAVRMFDLIHTVDSLKLAEELHGQAKKISKIQQILIQVNVSGEKTKSGVSFADTLPLIRETARLEHLKIEGLMTMPPYFDAPDKARPYFKMLRELSQFIDSEKIPNVGMKELSMGMSGDFKAAIEEGATLVRIGTAIFGHRP